MTEKRFENRLNKNNIKFNTLNPVWDNTQETAINVFEMIDLLNVLNDENRQMGIFLEALTEELSLANRDNTALEEENKQLLKEKNSWRDSWLEEMDDQEEQSKTILKLMEENEKLKADLKDCKKLKGKRLNKIRNHRAVIEDLGGSIRAYKGQITQLNNKIEKIQEAMEDTGALTKRQLEEILNA